MVIHLPREAYTSRDWFEKEQKYLFSKTWQYAGFVEDLAEPGQFMTVQAGLNNIFIIKGRDQRLRAFHNLCRHRGTQLLRACGKAEKVISCPYHSWTYSLNGELLSVPEREAEFPDLDMSRLGLLPASVETWLGMIWVHPDPEAMSLLHWMGEAQHSIGPHRPEELVEYAEAATEDLIQANWKIVVENYIDGYHLAQLHSESLYMYDHQQQKTGFVGPHFVFYEPLEAEYGKNIHKNAPMPVIDHFTEEQPIGAYVPMLFPNLGIGASESSWSIFHIIPLAPDQTRVITRTRLMPVSASKFSWQAWRSMAYFGSRHNQSDDEIKGAGDFMAEDVLVCEQQQKALASPYFSVGATAKHKEASVLGFQKVVAAYLEKMGAPQ